MKKAVLTIFLLSLFVISCSLEYDETDKLYPPDILCGKLVSCFDKNEINLCELTDTSCFYKYFISAYEHCGYDLTLTEMDLIKKSLPDFMKMCNQLTDQLEDPYEKLNWCMQESNDQELLIFYCKIQ
jgi:hypothetical protein